MIFPLATFCSMSTGLSFLRSNMFDSCSKLVAPVFCCDLCLYLILCPNVGPQALRRGADQCLAQRDVKQTREVCSHTKADSLYT